jgi:glyoxylase-like metal-dependent hydrolase (beta-lactamase superfamily II)
VQTITATDLLDRLDDPRLVLLDVREPDEFADWRIPGSQNVPLSQVVARADELPEGEVVAVCAVGVRATQAVELLGATGRQVTLLEGGMTAWANAYDEAVLTFGSATVVQVRRRGKGCLSYLVGAGASAIAIDPAAEISQYLDRAWARGWSITHVVDTHLHADHLSGARALAAAAGARLVLNPDDGFEFAHEDLRDGASIPLGDGVALTVSVLSAPGHTRGSTAFVLEGQAIFTGDTLFLESVGRPDLADKAEPFAHDLYRTLHDKVLCLGDQVVVLPAHFGAAVDVHAGEAVSASLGELRRRLPALDAEENAFVEWAVGAASPRPPNYLAIVEANQRGSSIRDDERRDLEAGPNRCAVAR